MAEWYQDVGMGAEYRFVPLHPKVAPAPLKLGNENDRLSHAKALKGGYSGKLTFQLEATSKVLFGAAGPAAYPDTGVMSSPSVTEHTKIHNAGNFAAPGHAIRGLIRSVFGVATFSRFHPVNGDHRFFSRNMELRALSLPQERPTPAWLIPELSNELVIWRLVPIDHQSVKRVASHWIAGFYSIDELASSLVGNEKQLYTSALGKALYKNKHLYDAFKQKFKREYIKANGNKDRRQISEYVKEQVRRESRNPNGIKVTEIDVKHSLWLKLSLRERSRLISSIYNKLNGGQISGRYISGERKDAYLVTAGPMATRESELLFPLPSSRGDEVDPTAIANFLFVNSAYSKHGAKYEIGGKRKPDGNFLTLLCEYLGNPEVKEREHVARLLGISMDQVAAERLRKDNPPGIPVYVSGNTKGPDLEMGTSQVIPHRPTGDVLSFLPEEHRSSSADSLDWADTLFGAVREDELKKSGQLPTDATLKSRVSFEFCTVATELNEQHVMPNGKALKVLQGQPRASFDPFSLRRREPRQNLSGEKPASWMNGAAEVAGYRRYPASATVPVDLFLAASEVVYGPGIRKPQCVSEMTSIVRPLTGVEYDCSIEFHNLHPLELGALLWSLSFGDREVFKHGGRPTKYRHVGGRLRNKGFGRLRPHSAKITLWGSVDADGNFSEQDSPDPATLMTAFEIAMGRFLDQNATEPEQARITFYKSPTITALLNSSDMEWKSDNHIPSRDRGGMFHLPPVQDGDEGGAKSDDIFKSFQNLRKFVYKAEPGYPPIGKTTFMDEFESPTPEPPEVGAAELEAARSLAEPYMENLTKSA